MLEEALLVSTQGTKSSVILPAKRVHQKQQRKHNLGYYKLRWITGKSEETKARSTFIRFSEELGRVVINKSSLEKNKSLRLRRFLTGCGRRLVRCCWGREGSPFFFFKVGDEIPRQKCLALLRYLFFSFLLLGTLAALRGPCETAPPSGHPHSILKEGSFVYFYTGW